MPLVVVLVVLVRACRERLMRLPASVGMVAAAVMAETVLPPLSWAPPHPQYHLQMVLAAAVMVVPLLIGLFSLPRGRLAAVLFFVCNAALSAFRYTRYPGY